MRRLSPAGWLWLAYSTVLTVAVVSCSGCATPPPAPAAPAAGLTCRIQGERYTVSAPMPTAAGWWAVRHQASAGRAGLWVVPAQQLEGCAP